ncbi:MAG: hypothetical protein A2Z99_12530 [Treponema sp. GWB1_62_6]|nr:MAG: hypothetical protein A2001_17645 [Treponema sp. GWC1_61_84]OHE67483.1 MAG: hypothetical protein A2Z99_12530 [Treponema sp. GWB1_62_6]OHE75995.1 MAG: hypothetical protein A2413_12765 [Treponema sp. RIFOXYC1_FULL_61_9]HCM29113.1 hypothetical protein [Treponema sp.]
MGADAEIVDGAFFAGLSESFEFFLIRHGESEGNSAGIFQGRGEYPLTALGREQAAERGRLLASWAPCPVLCSPLSRARESAEIIASGAGCAAPLVVDELQELDTGSWTSRSWSELRGESAERWAKFRSESWASVEGAESPEALYGRAIAAWGMLRSVASAECAKPRPTAIPTDGHPARPRAIVAVTHGGFLQWLVRATFGCRSWFPLVPLGNCTAYRLRTEPASADRAYIAWDALDDRLPVGAATGRTG